MDKSYTEKTIDFYSPYQEKISQARKSIEDFQHNLGFSNVEDITIRCTNAITRTSKYFNQHGFDYQNNDVNNSDHILMAATEGYIFAKYIEAQKLLNEYLKDINKTSDEIVNSISFKLFQKTRKPLSKAKLELYKQLRWFIPKEKIQGLLITDYEVRSKYIEYQQILEKYNQLSEEVANFEIENEVYDVIEFYLPNLYNNLKKIEFSKDDDENRKLRNKVFAYQLTKIIISLKKLNLTDKIEQIAKQSEEIMTEDLREHIQSELIRINGIAEEYENESKIKKSKKK